MIEQVSITPIGSFPYMTPCSVHSTGLGGDSYNTDFCVAPRNWRESINWISMVGTVKRTLPDADFAIWFFATMDTTYWPSWSVMGWECNGVTGEFIRYLPISGNVATIGLTYCRLTFAGGMVVRGSGLFGIFTEYWSVTPENPVTPFAKVRDIDPNIFDSANGGSWDTNFMALDETADMCIIHTSTTPNGCVTVCKFSTGELVHHVPIAGNPTDALIDELGRCYVICGNGNICLIDYKLGELQSLTCTTIPANTIWGYDPFLRRLLSCTKTPNAADGSSTIQVKGFRNIPHATSLSKPVPLSRPRVGQKVRLISRVTGDINEVVASTPLNATVDTANGTLLTPSTSTDANGYAFFEVDCKTAGAISLTVSGDIK